MSVNEYCFRITLILSAIAEDNQLFYQRPFVSNQIPTSIFQGLFDAEVIFFLIFKGCFDVVISMSNRRRKIRWDRIQNWD